jgi:hypothetical protein
MFVNPIHQTYESPILLNPDYVATERVRDSATDYEEPVALNPAYGKVRTNRIDLDAENYVSSPPQLAESTYARPDEDIDGATVDLDAENYVSPPPQLAASTYARPDELALHGYGFDDQAPVGSSA